MKKSLLKEHQYLLMRRECRVVVGRKAINLWLLVAVLLATFLAIAFSAGSMAYLDDKMNDPFTNWVNITRKGGDLEAIGKIRPVLESDTIRERYQFDEVKTEITESRDMVSVTGKAPVFSIIYYEDLHSDLIAAVMSPKNVVGGMAICSDSIDDHSIGIVMTLDALHNLGYSTDNMPAFVDCHEVGQGADSLGFEVLSNASNGFSHFVRAPLPLLAVVKRLPMNKEILASKYLREQFYGHSLHMSNEDYARKLRFFVPVTVTDFNLEMVTPFVPDSLKNTVYVYPAEERIQRRLCSWRDGQIISVDVGYPGTPLPIVNSVEREVLSLYSGKGVQRVYDYKESTKNRWEEGRSGTDDDVISVHFARLDSIRAFEQFVKDTSESQLQIEMTQVNSKENFNAVSIMATILSAAMIVFSIVCIVIFLTNMLQSYFQKVRRNLGTFKAFGMSTRELMRVYVAIIIGIVVAALLMALAAAWLTELMLMLFGVMKDGIYSWLILWNSRTLWAIVIILVATVLTVLFVMRRLLRQTPGNLIYDR